MPTLTFGHTIIDYQLSYRDRKTLGIRVHPDTSVEVIAPLESEVDKINEKLIKKAPWIIKQQDFFLSFRPHTPIRKYISGETHLYLGRQYRLKVIQSDVKSVKLQGGSIVIQVKDCADTNAVQKLLNEWYKQKAIVHFEYCFNQLLPIAKKLSDITPILKYKWMTKRWGSCDKKGNILLNLELIKAPKACIEYVILHEFCHLKHHHHGKPFYELLEKVCPRWKDTKMRLEKLMV